MTKAEIVTEIANTTGIEKKDVLNTIEAFMEVVKESLTTQMATSEARLTVLKSR